MIDIKFLRENPDVVRENIRRKFQDAKLPLVDEVIALDAERRKIMQEADTLRANRNKLSKQIGALMGQGKKEEAEEMKRLVTENANKLAEDEALVFVITEYEGEEVLEIVEDDETIDAVFVEYYAMLAEEGAI